MTFFIRCRTAPVGPEGPLFLHLTQDTRILNLHIGLLRPQPLGLNLDGTLIIDMQPDGGVDGIEILRRPDKLRTATQVARPTERYWRIFLEASSKELVEREANVAVKQSGLQVTYLFDERTVDSTYLIGPGVHALVAKNNFVGLSVDLTPFAL